jgi:hypothetical protein
MLVQEEQAPISHFKKAFTHHFSKHHVLAVEPFARAQSDVKLRIVGVPPRVCHCYYLSIV